MRECLHGATGRLRPSFAASAALATLALLGALSTGACVSPPPKAERNSDPAPPPSTRAAQTAGAPQPVEQASAPAERGRAPASNNGAAPSDTAADNDDDITASRLRRLAQQQTDPVLKQKLWAEYLAYKGHAAAR